MRMPKKLKSRWLILGGFCFGLAILYRVNGISTYFADEIQTPCLYVPSGLEHRAMANCEGISKVQGASASMRFNSAGLRDREYPKAAPAGVVRILELGSSLSLGVGLPEEDSFPRRLETELRGKGHRVEVINAGMVGYCTIQSAFRARELIELYSPDLVLMQFVAGNCTLFDGAWHGRVVWEQDRPVRIDRTPFRGLLSFLNPTFFRFPSLFFLWLTAADQARKAKFSWKVFLSGARAEAVAATSLRYLDYLRREAEKKGAGFVVATYRMPVFTQAMPSQHYSLVVQLMRFMMVPFGITAEDIFEELRAKGIRVLAPSFVKRGFAIEHDMHMNAEGTQEFARLIAAELAAHLKKRKGGK